MGGKVYTTWKCIYKYYIYQQLEPLQHTWARLPSKKKFFLLIITEQFCSRYFFFYLFINFYIRFKMDAFNFYFRVKALTRCFVPGASTCIPSQSRSLSASAGWTGAASVLTPGTSAGCTVRETSGRLQYWPSVNSGHWPLLWFCSKGFYRRIPV